MARVLLIGMGAFETRQLKRIYESVNVFCDEVKDFEAGLEKITEDPPVLVFAKEPDHLATVESMRIHLKKESPTTPLLVLLKNRNMKTALEIMRAGAFDCLSHPFKRFDVLAASKKATGKNGRTLTVEKIEPPKRRLEQITGTMVGAMLALFLFLGYVDGPPVNTLNLDSKFLSGLQWEEEYLWAGDWFNATVTKFKRTRGLTRSGRELVTDGLFRMKDGQPILICNTPTSLVTVGTDLKIRSHKWDVGLPILQTLDGPGTQPVGLGWDGEHLWLADKSTGLLYRYDQFFKVIGTEPSLITDPVAIASAENSLWIVGGEPLRAAQIQKVKGRYVWKGPYQIADWIPAKKNITGLAIGFNRLWVSVEGDEQIVSKSLDEIIKKQIPWKVAEKKKEKKVG